MKAIATTKPKIKREVFSRAIAATATTLSIDMETSAIVIVVSAFSNCDLSLPDTSIVAILSFDDLVL